jgi:hypothetical protein
MRGNSNSRVSETVQNKGFCKVGNGLLLMVLSEIGRLKKERGGVRRDDVYPSLLDE